MTPADQFPPPLHNVLPLRFHTWTALYDSIPESQRQASQFRVFQGLTKKQFARVYGYGQPLGLIGKAEYLIEREWLLARIGEELLATRLTRSQFQELKVALRSTQGLTVSERLRVGGWALGRWAKFLIQDKETGVSSTQQKRNL
jgi:hypothetical protein